MDESAPGADASAVGTFIPVPLVGTAVGAIVGAGVGIFVSGAVDSGFEQGLHPVAALSAGAKPFVGAGTAVGGGVKKAWNSIF